MAGWDNDIAYSNNADYSTAGATGGTLANGLITNGELWIGRTAVNAGGTHISVGNITSPDGSVTVGYTAPNITLVANATNIPYISLTPYIVGKPGDIHAGFFTIQSAINAAVADGATAANPLTVKIKPGHYTENLTLAPGVSITGQGCDPFSPSVWITGAHTYTGTGGCTLANLAFEPNAQHVFTITGTAALTFTLSNCNFNLMQGGTFIMQYANTNASSRVEFLTCFSDTSVGGTPGIMDNPNPPAAGTLFFNNTYLVCGGVTANGTNLIINSCNLLGTMLAANGGTLLIENSVIGNSAAQGQAIAVGGGSPGFCAAYNSTLFGGTSPAVTLVAGTSITLSNCSLSSDAPGPLFAIDSNLAGGTLVYDNLSFFGTIATIDTSITQTFLQFIGSKVRANGLAYLHGGTAYAYTATPISYGVLVSDVIIGVTSTAAPRTITMPNAGMTIGQRWTIKDESGGAASNNITISGNGANIDGASTFVMASNFQSVDIYWNGTNFFIV